MPSFGPTLPLAQEVHTTKYRGEGETFYEYACRVAAALSDNQDHRGALKDILLTQRFLPAGRIQSAIGAPRQVTPYNCFVSGTIPDSMDGIMKRAAEAAQTMRMGGGIGYDFSTLRPRGARIKTLASSSCGPVGFANIFDSVCGTISSAGHRRGAQMGVLRVDHPDIEEFVRVKNDLSRLTNFNLSVAVTNSFMRAVERGDNRFDLVFEGDVYKQVNPRALWDEIMRSTWDYAEPGVIFIDRMNEMNNLWYVEQIASTNPCSEQPLPPFGACLLGSFNLTKYIEPNMVVDRINEYGGPTYQDGWCFAWDQFIDDIPHVVRAMDNVIDQAIYPLPEQEKEAKLKRRMGLGITGLANAGEALGHTYGSEEFIAFTKDVMKVLRDTAYGTSCILAQEKGEFPLCQVGPLSDSKFLIDLPDYLYDDIRKHGLRNSHLISIAPTGTISLTADNVSSGIEPVFSHGYTRTINMPDGVRKELVEDYGVRVFGVEGKTADQCSMDDHLNVLLACQPYVDSAISKTINVGPDVTWEQFKDVYMKAWKGGAKGCTTFRSAGKRMGILNAKDDMEPDGTACYFDPETGRKTCE